MLMLPPLDEKCLSTPSLSVWVALRLEPSDPVCARCQLIFGLHGAGAGIELETDDLLLQQTTNSSWYYLLMSTRSDWIHSTLVPSTIAASAPYPHGYFVK